MLPSFHTVEGKKWFQKWSIIQQFGMHDFVETHQLQKKMYLHLCIELKDGNELNYILDIKVRTFSAKMQ